MCGPAAGPLLKAAGLGFAVVCYGCLVEGGFLKHPRRQPVYGLLFKEIKVVTFKIKDVPDKAGCYEMKLAE